MYQRGLPPSALSLQACADSGHGLSIVAQEHPAAVSPADCPGVRGAVSRDQRDAAGAAGPSLHGGGAHRAGHSLLAAGRADEPVSARPMWKRSVISPRGWSCSRLCRTLLSAPSKNSRCKLALGAALMATKGYAAPEVERAYARARELCQQMGETPQLFPVLLGLGRFISYGQSSRRRVSWRSSFCVWPSACKTRFSS